MQSQNFLGFGTAKVIFSKKAFGELGRTEVQVYLPGTPHPRKKAPGTGASASFKVWLLLGQCR